MAELKYWLWLTTRKGLGPTGALAVLDHFSTPERAFYGEQEDFEALPLSPFARQSLLDKSLDQANQILGDCDRLGIRIMTFQDAGYPQRLRQIAVPPAVLYIKGKTFRFDEEAAIGVVGMRKSSQVSQVRAQAFGMELAANGASPNAFTSNDITGYYFDSTEKFEENLRILLSFVSVPWFTQESVDKERGIIGQEIGMIEDDPHWKCYMNLMKALFQHHPIRVSVAGSVESIAEITPETLYACHKAFYDPANMVLCVAGPVDPEHICDVAREILPKEAGPVAAKDYGEKEQPRAAQSYIEERMEVSAPIFQLGWKGDAQINGEDRLRQELVGGLALEVLLGNSSPLYAKLYREGLINQEFGYSYESSFGCAFLAADGESKAPEAVCAAVAAEAARIGREGVDPALWVTGERTALSVVRAKEET